MPDYLRKKTSPVRVKADLARAKRTIARQNKRLAPLIAIEAKLQKLGRLMVEQ